MIRVENIDVFNFEGAIRGMRNPLQSHEKSDSKWEYIGMDDVPNAHAFIIGDNDLDLMQRLYKAGTEHRKYLRQIFVSMDIIAPLYWWKEMDQYRINVTTNSCSTMHKIAAKEFKLDDFSHEHLIDYSIGIDKGHSIVPSYLLQAIIDVLNLCRKSYLETKDKKYWWQLIQLLPSSYNQRRTITMNYENVVAIIKQRTGHKLDEWNEFTEILRDLPYIEEIIGGAK